MTVEVEVGGAAIIGFFDIEISKKRRVAFVKGDSWAIKRSV